MAGQLRASINCAGMTAFVSYLITYVMMVTILSTLSLSCLVGSGSSMHVLPVMPRILDISAVVVGSNISIGAVKQGFAPGSGSTAVVRCKLTSNMSIFSWKKRENISQPPLGKIREVATVGRQMI